MLISSLLGLGDPVCQVSLSLAEHTPVLYDQYRSVSLTLTFSDGTTESAFLTPLVFVAPPTAVPVVNSEQRLVGYSASDSSSPLDSSHQKNLAENLAKSKCRSLHVGMSDWRGNILIVFK